MRTPRIQAIRGWQVVLVLSLLLAWSARHVSAQALDIVFRYASESPLVSANVPGDFNGWQTSGGASSMSWVDSLGQWVRPQSFSIGQTTEYRFFVVPSGGSGVWLSDPANPETNPQDNNNSVLRVADPLIFQPIPQENADGLVDRFSAGIFSTMPISLITLTVGTQQAVDVTSLRDADSGILFVRLDSPVVPGTLFQLHVVSGAGEADVSIGALSEPLSWTTIDRRTTMDSFRVRGIALTSDGQVDPAVSSVQLFRNGMADGTLDVLNGQVDSQLRLDPGENRFQMRATVGGDELESEDLIITRRGDPIEERLFDIDVSGSGFSFTLDVVDTPRSAGATLVTFTLDEVLSTTSTAGFSAAGSIAEGSVSGPGEVFVDIDYVDASGKTDQARAAIVVGEDGSARDWSWAERASWIDQAVVYEIFPLSFGPVEATGTVGAEGNRFNEITEALPYIGEMGFNTIWFMPIMQNQSMSQLGGGYNTIDFKRVDPKLGTNEDFKALVDRAHELGIRIVLDITVNHASPDHPWVESLRENGDYPGFVQTTPSSHNRGLDGFGASLQERWSGDGLYRVYDGFGDLANLDWDSDDLQAEMLEILAWWLTEFDIDGYRFDAYWGPWRRYGPDRFGRPVREVMRRYRPDSWALGEIEGTGPGTEVYYADAEAGTSVEGGLDSAYDWAFSGFVSSTSNYARVSNYKTLITNYGFRPGPNMRWFRFLENHDWTRIQEIFKSNPDRIKPLTGMLMTIPGIPLIYQGQEVGYGAGSGDRRRLPVSWNVPDNRQWARMHHLLATARATFPAFGTNDITFIDAPSSVLAFVRPFNDQNAVVVINFAGTSQQISIDPSNAVDVSIDGPIPYFNLAADTTGAHLGGFSLELAPYETVIFMTSDHIDFDLGPLPELPYNAVYTSTEEVSSVPQVTVLQSVWPNPARTSATVELELADRSVARVEMFDVLGRRIQTVANGVYQAGIHQLQLDVSTVSPGLYLLRLTLASEAGSIAASESLTKPLIVVK